MAKQRTQQAGAWPRLRLEDWAETRDTLHMWTQIVGKIRLDHAPPANQWWQVTLYVTPRGLSTSTVPYRTGAFDIEFDFIEHRLGIRVSDGSRRELRLESKPVSQFYSEVMGVLGDLGIQTRMYPRPNEVPVAIPFPEDHRHAAYDPYATRLFWGQLLSAHRVFGEFRSHFVGKASPVHFFWGAMDLCVTRFSGRTAPPHPPGGVPNLPDRVTQEAYSVELSSCGFWPGGGAEGGFYSYAYPEPTGFADQPVQPETASYRREVGEFVLPYEAVATAPDPDRTLSEFLHSTYGAAAELADWDRAVLEADPVHWEHR
ncbi:DUF5996 family protein [Streptomyces rugosispiralis]|uniref:DUF5996 family protein n=1 Tax=Streptomyces rugosispiralis TaxID=2967341 RepID=A0ABT1V5Z4_9ACTN|nr:DUF5996 family protein [Streptomyces rugosispiralis]MCQ8192798.1 DUF5996 family protein [Streptomyces rugosispiralis]